MELICVYGAVNDKIENLKKYPEIFPWVSDVMIFEKYRGPKLQKKTRSQIACFFSKTIAKKNDL